MRITAGEVRGKRAGMPAERLATATIAQLYAQQGKLEQAARVYERLLEADPSSEPLRQALAAIQAKRGHNDPAGAGGEDRLAVQRRGQGLACRWQVSDEGIRRGRLILGVEGRLALRVIGFQSEGGEPAQSDRPPCDRVLPTSTGSMDVPVDVGAIFGVAAVGLLSDTGAFVSIAHAEIVRFESELESSRA